MNVLFLGLLFFLYLVTPGWASYSFDGTNDRIDGPDDGSSGLDVANFSIGIWVRLSAQPGATMTVQIHGTDPSSGGIRSLQIQVPGTSGFRWQLFQNFATNAGFWDYQTDLNLNTWYLIGCDYDSNAANDPTCYVNGSAVTVAETSVPSGARSTGDDNFVLGESMAGTQDYAGLAARAFFYNARLAAADWLLLSQCNSPLTVQASSLVYFVELRSDAADQKGNLGTLTIAGAVTNSAHPCRGGGGGPIIFQ